jgi:hypothetical protein
MDPWFLTVPQVFQVLLFEFWHVLFPLPDGLLHLKSPASGTALLLGIPPPPVSVLTQLSGKSLFLSSWLGAAQGWM